MALILVLAFLSLILVTSGFILVYISRHSGRMAGWYMIVAAVLLFIIAVLLYSSGHYYYERGVVYPAN